MHNIHHINILTIKYIILLIKVGHRKKKQPVFNIDNTLIAKVTHLYIATNVFLKYG